MLPKYRLNLFKNKLILMGIATGIFVIYQGWLPLNQFTAKDFFSSTAVHDVRAPVKKTSSSTFSYGVVSRVVDGDTIDLESGERVRYIGMDTPETVDPRRTVQCFGKEASERNKELVVGKKVRLEKDVSETDRYGRLLRYVYLEDGTFVNVELVKEGYARALTISPDVAKSSLFVAAARRAREEQKELWAVCK